MMKHMILAIAIALSATIGVNAQEVSQNAPRHKGRPTPEQMVEMRVNQLDKELQLTADQKAAITAIYADEMKQMKEARKDMQKAKPQPPQEKVDSGEGKAQFKGHKGGSRGLHTRPNPETEAKIEAVLTADQKAKYAELKKQRPPRREDAGKGGGKEGCCKGPSKSCCGD